MDPKTRKSDQGNACVERDITMTKQTNNSMKTYRLVLSALMVAMATVLSLLTPIQLPFGGSVTLFSMVPLIVVSWLYGPKWGMGTGLVFGLIQMLFGMSNFGYVSGMVAYTILILADYIVPFTAMGLAGIFRGKIRKDTVAISVGAVMSCLIRFVCHFISGVTIWNSFANGHTWKLILIYSLTYNGSYMVPETIITVLGCILLAAFLLPRLDQTGRLRGKKS